LILLIKGMVASKKGMKNAIYRKTNFLVFIIPLMMMLSMILIVKSSLFQFYPYELSIAVTLDLILTIPLIYFLLIRKKEIPKITILTAVIVGIVIANYIIPNDYQYLLNKIELYIIPIVEILVLTFIFINVRKILKLYKTQKNNSSDFFTVLNSACKEILPKGISILLATEIAVIYYSFINWRKRKLAVNEFSYHKENGIIAMLYAVIFIILIETFVLHILLQKWNITVAWIVTSLSIYTCLQIFALIRSMSKRPIIIDLKEKKIHLRYGFFSESTIHFNSIKDVEFSSKSLADDKSIVQFSPLGNLTSHNLIIHLKSKNILSGFYGIKKTYKSIAIQIDKKEKFKNKIDTILQ